MTYYINLIGNISLFIFVIVFMFFIKDSWEKEKADRKDREEKIENMYNKVMGKNEKRGGK